MGLSHTGTMGCGMNPGPKRKPSGTAQFRAFQLISRSEERFFCKNDLAGWSSFRFAFETTVKTVPLQNDLKVLYLNTPWIELAPFFGGGGVLLRCPFKQFKPNLQNTGPRAQQRPQMYSFRNSVSKGPGKKAFQNGAEKGLTRLVTRVPLSAKTPRSHRAVPNKSWVANICPVSKTVVIFHRFDGETNNNNTIFRKVYGTPKTPCGERLEPDIAAGVPYLAVNTCEKYAAYCKHVLFSLLMSQGDTLYPSNSRFPPTKGVYGRFAKAMVAATSRGQAK